MVMIAMMHCQFMQILIVEFTAATPADPGVQFKRLFPVATQALIILSPRISYNSPGFVRI